MKLTSLLLGTALARQGECTVNYPVVQNFNAESYMGTWYEIVKDKSNPFEWDAQCTEAMYALESDGKISVKNRAWYWYTLFNYYEVDG